MQTKLLTHMFALCLRVDNCATDSAQLATDLQMAQAQVNGLFKTMGCKIGKMTERDRARLGVADDKKRAVLSAPPSARTRSSSTRVISSACIPLLPCRSDPPVPASRARMPSCPRQPIPSPRKTVIADAISSTRRRVAPRSPPAYVQSAAVVDYPLGTRPPSPRMHSASPTGYTPPIIPARHLPAYILSYPTHTLRPTHRIHLQSIHRIHTAHFPSTFSYLSLHSPSTFSSLHFHSPSTHLPSSSPPEYTTTTTDRSTARRRR
ncbi:hypothetical protein EV714DRAFT_278393 [Schizophyllum commune]